MIAVSEVSTKAQVDGLINFLSSKKFKGIGKKTAEKIVKSLGIDCINILKNQSIFTLKLDPSLKEKARIIKEQLDDSKNLTIFEILCRRGLQPAIAQRLIYTLEEHQIQEILKDPNECYTIFPNHKGFGFIKTDSIATTLGEVDVSYRVLAAIKYLREEENIKGHHYLEKSALIQKLVSIFDDSNASIERKVIIENLKDLKASEILIDSDFNQKITKHRKDYYLEKYLAQSIKSRIYHKEERGLTEWLAYRHDQLAEEENFYLSIKQQEALKMIFSESFSLLLGSAGTGKSKLVSIVVDLLLGLQQKILVLAPTGKAIQRMKELLEEKVNNITISTIHRFLRKIEWEQSQKMKLEDDKWKDEDNGIHEDEEDSDNIFDICIIDESSMVTTELLEKTLVSISPTTKVLLVGDPHQLPSIGAGNCLADLVKSDIIPKTALDVPQRSQGKHGLINLSQEVRYGKFNPASIPLFTLDDYERSIRSLRDIEIAFIPSGQTEITDTIKSIIRSFRVNNYIDILNELIVITPTNENINGTIALNENLQPIFNQEGGFISYKTPYSIGDRIMQLKNEYSGSELISANGEIGFVVGGDKATGKINIRWAGKTKAEPHYYETNTISLNYAQSVHKSQGSEYQAVIIVLDKAHIYQHCRQLIYTAITRAKRHLILVGDLDVFKYAIENNRPSLRRTELAEYLKI